MVTFRMQFLSFILKVALFLIKHEMEYFHYYLATNIAHETPPRKPKTLEYIPCLLAQSFIALRASLKLS